jgi:hypothetical protein
MSFLSVVLLGLVALGACWLWRAFRRPPADQQQSSKTRSISAKETDWTTVSSSDGPEPNAAPSAGGGAELLETIFQTLNRPNAPFRLERGDRSLRIVPSGPATFAVDIEDAGDELVVYACNWRDYYEDAQQAGGCVMGLLSPYYRVVEYLDAGVPVWSLVERYESDGWRQIGGEGGPADYWKTQSKLTPKTKTRRIFQQAVIVPPFSWTERFPGAQLDDRNLPLGSVLGVREETIP